ncbi:MAG: glycosyltransferase family 39 protein [Vicinamibacterales bacterium]
MTSGHGGRCGWCEGALLLVILAAGLWLRLRGLSFGLPAVYNPDEIAILSRSLAFGTGDLNPHNFLYPTFYFYVLFAWIGAYFVAGRITGHIQSLPAFQTDFFVDPSHIYLAGRSLSVVCGLATVAAVWWLARRLFGPRVAVAAACFMAVAPAAIRDAHYIKHDVPVTLAVVCAVTAIRRLWPWTESSATTPSRPAGESLGPTILAGAACGVAFSTHYYAVFLTLPLLVAVFTGHRDTASTAVRRLVVAVATATFMFFLLSPFLLWEPATAVRDIVANRRIVVDRSGVSAVLPFPGLGTYLLMLGREAVGWPVAVLAVWGAMVLWTLSRRVALWWVSFPLAFFLFISTTVPASRYLNPIVPFIAVLAALGANDLVVRLRTTQHGVLLAGAAIAAIVPAVTQGARIGSFFRQTDTRTLAQQFVEQTVQPGMTVLVQPYSVQLTQSREGLVEALTAHLGDSRRASTKFSLRLGLDPWPQPAYRTLFLGSGGLDADKIYTDYAAFAGERGPETLRLLDVDYVVLKRYPEDDMATAPLRATLERHGRLVQRFSPYRPDAAAGAAAAAPYEHNTDTPLDVSLERPGPIMEIWAVR